jgi:hypothetical protein
MRICDKCGILGDIELQIFELRLYDYYYDMCHDCREEYFSEEKEARENVMRKWRLHLMQNINNRTMKGAKK